MVHSDSTPAESHDTNFLSITLLFQIPQDSIYLPGMEEKGIYASRISWA
jgi:hypothetical protein